MKYKNKYGKFVFFYPGIKKIWDEFNLQIYKSCIKQKFKLN